MSHYNRLRVFVLMLTQHHPHPTNIIGLKLLLKLGLDLDPDRSKHSSDFIFKKMPVAF